MLIVLSTLPMGENQTLARQFPRIDIIIAAGNSAGNVGPIRAGNAIIVQTAARGQYLGSLTRDFTADPRTGPSGAEPPSDAAGRFTCEFLKITQSGAGAAWIERIVARTQRAIKTTQSK